MTLDIRPSRPDDLPTAVAIRSRVFPYEISALETFRWHAEKTPAQARFRMFVAELGGRVVGYSTAMLTWDSSRPDQGRIVAMVDPDHRRTGVGSALVNVAEGHLRTAGATIVRSAGPIPEADEFAHRRGYERRSISHHQELDLAGLPVPPPKPAGVELRPTADYADDPRPVHAVDEAVSADEPSDIPIDAMPYDTWLDLVWNEPRLDHELSVVLLVDGRPGGIVAFQSDRRTRLVSAMTGTLREYRGRRFAKYAKAAALHRARERGFRLAYTANDHTNAPMLAINTWLGYRHHTTEGHYDLALCVDS
ncbi:GNAT family N-acetyltransferase [Nocardiopsis gilva YIM 90087]|uniref:GNAT family N-acetyltransferase n=1 Tax=Nocardiopsis gilva YIM 90087 TaxID=1235441 RepID=A0A223S908_9ACTN|nr:GNAT family N-acetyltransferase [Nocardiopsis gilva]ASU84607.1 GNAT family N-acetyltransferase [Nocardiopsis gilva YIM 90087]